MVRLKGLPRDNRVDVLVISIPYGSIKSASETQVYRREQEFQFLMVRLKEESVAYGRDKCPAISIPYGSIKS